MAERSEVRGIELLGRMADAYAQAEEAYDRARDRGYPVCEATALRQAAEAYATAKAQYPQAAALLMAECWARAAHDRKVAAGQRAVERLLAGESAGTVIGEMQSEWSAAARESALNA